MFLKFRNQNLSGLTPAAIGKGETGSALIAVMGVLFVGLLVLVLLAANLTSAFTYTSVTRAEVQSQAAAESGIAVAVAGINTKYSCENSQGTYTSVNVPVFRATVWRSIDGISWVRGCPLTTSKKVRIISSGSAQSRGILSANSGNVRIVEAIYNYGKTVDGTTSAPAMYVYSIGTLDTYRVLSPGGESSDVAVRTGNFACTGPTVVEGSVFVAEGNANLTNSCTVKGSVSARGPITLTVTSNIYGDATSATGGVSLENVTDTVRGNVYANGSATIHGDVGGLVEATGLVTLLQGGSVASSVASGSGISASGSIGGSVITPGSITIKSTARILGSVTVGGTVTYGKLKGSAAVTALHAEGIVTGPIAFGVSGLTAPTPRPAPVVNDWTDFAYNFADWRAQGFTQEITWPASLGCRVGDSNSTSPSGSLYAFYNRIRNLTTPTVIDARGCSTISGDLSLPVTTEVSFIGNNFNFDSLAVWGADSDLHNVWFIAPDAQPTVPGPQCSKHGSEFIINTTSTIGAGVNAIAYAPCSIGINNGTEWTGQLYSGDMNGGGGVRVLNFVPIGIPGSSIGGGSSSGAVYRVGTLVQQRNRTDNGE